MNRSFMGPPGVFMADADVPDRFWPAVRLVVNNLVWILPLVAIEQMVAGELSRAVYLGIVFVIDLVVAVKWGLLETLFGKAGRMGTIQLTLLAGVLGTWLFLTMGLAATAWMIWNFPYGIAANKPAPPADEGPIQWNGSFGIEGDLATKVASLRFIGANISKTHDLQLKEANIISRIDGTRVLLEIVAVNGAGDNKIVPIDQIQLIPPGARIELVAKVGPPDPNSPGNILGVEPKAFLEKWRQFAFHVKDDIRSYDAEFNDSHFVPFFSRQSWAAHHG